MPALKTPRRTITTRVGAHRLVARHIGADRWLAEYEPETPVLSRHPELRSTYEGPLAEVLTAAQSDGAQVCYDEQEWCFQHGWRYVEDGDSFTGFAGGQCTWMALSCGCTILDDSNDLAAAR